MVQQSFCRWKQTDISLSWEELLFSLICVTQMPIGTKCYYVPATEMLHWWILHISVLKSFLSKLAHRREDDSETKAEGSCHTYTRFTCFCCGALSLDCVSFSDLLGLPWMLLGKCKYICNSTESSPSFPKAITELRTKYFGKGSLIYTSSVLDEGYSKHAFLLESKTFICTSLF